MTPTPAGVSVGWLTRWASGLRFPTLLAVIATLFLLDLAIPDLVPLADEVLLGLFTVLLASLRRRKAVRTGEAATDGPIESQPVTDRGGTPRPDR